MKLSSTTTREFLKQTKRALMAKSQDEITSDNETTETTFSFHFLVQCDFESTAHQAEIQLHFTRRYNAWRYKIITNHKEVERDDGQE